MGSKRKIIGMEEKKLYEVLSLEVHDHARMEICVPYFVEFQLYSNMLSLRKCQMTRTATPCEAQNICAVNE